MTWSWPRAPRIGRSSWWMVRWRGMCPAARRGGPHRRALRAAARRSRPTPSAARRERSDDPAHSTRPARLRGSLPRRGPPAAGGEPVSALGKIVRSGVGRRRVQSFVMGLTTLAAVTSSVLSLGLLTVVQAPFDHAFASRNAAHLAVQFDGTKATSAQAAATAQLAGVTESAGPYPITTNLTASIGPDCTATMGPGLPLAGGQAPPTAVTTRPDLAHSPMDRLVLTDGRWPANANEILL